MGRWPSDTIKPPLAKRTCSAILHCHIAWRNLFLLRGHTIQLVNVITLQQRNNATERLREKVSKGMYVSDSRMHQCISEKARRDQH